MAAVAPVAEVWVEDQSSLYRLVSCNKEDSKFGAAILKLQSR